jgi:hypothetical protein
VAIIAVYTGIYTKGRVMVETNIRKDGNSSVMETITGRPVILGREKNAPQKKLA